MARPRAVLVAVQLPGVDDEEHQSSLDELGRLASTLGLDVVGRVSQKRDRIDPGAVLGAGKLRELAALTGGPGELPTAAHAKVKKQVYAPTEKLEEDAIFEPIEYLPEEAWATHVLVDHDLGPSQARNLERASGAEVMDRTSVILGIFHRHARSREAKIEVEIARLKYLSPRLREVGGGGDRQRGGIGGKGAGESALELDKRKIRDRIAELSKELETVRKIAETQRQRRQEARKVALVGYTNAGKSSTMRALTGKEVYVADELFATLGTTVRVLPDVKPRVLVSDTVGFIKKLPHDLVASFRATLDEAASAELILHVVDASDPAFRSQMQVTIDLLEEIGVEAPRHLILNKIDQASTGLKASLREEFPEGFQMSAHDPADVKRLSDHVAAFFDQGLEELTLLVPWSAQGRLPTIHERCRVLETHNEAEGTVLRVRAPRAVLDGLRDLARG